MFLLFKATQLVIICYGSPRTCFFHGFFLPSPQCDPPQSPALCFLCSVKTFCFSAHLTFMQLRASRGADKTGPHAQPAVTVRKVLVFLSLSCLSYKNSYFQPRCREAMRWHLWETSPSLHIHKAMWLFSPAPALNSNISMQSMSHRSLNLHSHNQRPLASHTSFLSGSQATNQARGNEVTCGAGNHSSHQRCSRAKTGGPAFSFQHSPNNISLPSREDLIVTSEIRSALCGLMIPQENLRK